MAKTTPLGVRLDEDVREALTSAARDDARSISSLTSKIITDWLKSKGYLAAGALPAYKGEKIDLLAAIKDAEAMSGTGKARSKRKAKGGKR